MCRANDVWNVLITAKLYRKFAVQVTQVALHYRSLNDQAACRANLHRWISIFPTPDEYFEFLPGFDSTLSLHVRSSELLRAPSFSRTRYRAPLARIFIKSNLFQMFLRVDFSRLVEPELMNSCFVLSEGGFSSLVYISFRAATYFLNLSIN